MGWLGLSESAMRVCAIVLSAVDVESISEGKRLINISNAHVSESSISSHRRRGRDPRGEQSWSKYRRGFDRVWHSLNIHYIA